MVRKRLERLGRSRPGRFGRRVGARLTRGRVGTVVTLARRTLLDSREDRITGLGAEITFFTLVAIPPTLLVLAGGLGFAADILGGTSEQTMRKAILDVARSVLNDETVRETIRPTLDSLLAKGRADIMSVGAILALWSSSRATKVAVVATTIAYDMTPSRSMWRRRAVAVGLTAGAIGSALVVIPIMVVGPGLVESALRDAGAGTAAAPLAVVAHWLIIGAVAIGLLTTFYHVAPPQWTPWRRDLPGAVLALVVWIGGAVLLRTYIDWTIASDAAYGQLAAPIVILLWLYVTSLAVLFGAELNAEIEKEWPQDRHPKGHPSHGD